MFLRTVAAAAFAVFGVSATVTTPPPSGTQHWHSVDDDDMHGAVLVGSPDQQDEGVQVGGGPGSDAGVQTPPEGGEGAAV